MPNLAAAEAESTQEDKEKRHTAKPKMISESLALSVISLVTCYYAVEHSCCATHSFHCQDPCAAVFFCFQDALGTADCHARFLLLSQAQ